MLKQSFLRLNAVLLAVISAASWAQAQTVPSSPKAKYTADSKHAMERYKEDQKLCTEETTAESRMQCKRDAKQEYNKAIAAAKARMAAPAKAAAAHAACVDCGKVVVINRTEKEGEGSALGVIAGGAAGALLGRQVGGGTGKDVATIAGAVGGAYAGKQIEQKMKKRQVWVVTVEYNNGNKADFELDQDPGFKTGDLVKNADKTIVRQ